MPRGISAHLIQSARGGTIKERLSFINCKNNLQKLSLSHTEFLFPFPGLQVLRLELQKAIIITAQVKNISEQVIFFFTCSCRVVIYKPASAGSQVRSPYTQEGCCSNMNGPFINFQANSSWPLQIQQGLSKIDLFSFCSGSKKKRLLGFERKEDEETRNHMHFVSL